MAGHYTFMPWLRRGIANQITQAASAQTRATVTASVTPADGETTAAPVSQQFKLTGPGDIIGIDPDAIVRVEPKSWITDFEPNYLAFIEFYAEDFPWRYTPRRAFGSNQKHLPPWITLLVLKEDEFERNRLPGRPLTSVVVKSASPASLFPAPAQVWAWSHVQVAATFGSQDAPRNDQLNDVLADRPDIGVSRVMSPRKLDPDTAYTAFLVPTYETGRLAGLGIAFDDNVTPGLEFSWNSASEFPIYHEWFFRTGERGDFEELARRLVPRIVDKQVGIRDMDIAEPGFGMPVIDASDRAAVVGLEGALKSPQTESKPHTDNSKFPTDVASIVNAPALAEQNGDGDPLIAPPIYGRWHALVNRVDPQPANRSWVNTLNRDARHRAAAGLGADIARKNQEHYMKLAWEQVGDVLAANRKIALSQAAAMITRKLFDKTLARLDPEQALAIANPVLSRIRGTSGTVHAELRASRVTVAATSGPLRKLMRNRGKVARRFHRGAAAQATQQTLTTVVGKLNAKQATVNPEPDPVTAITLEDSVDFVHGNPPRPTLPNIPGLPTLPIIPTGPAIPTVPTLPPVGTPALAPVRPIRPGTRPRPNRPGVPTLPTRPPGPTVPIRPPLGGTPGIPTRPGTELQPGDRPVVTEAASTPIVIGNIPVLTNFAGVGFDKTQILATQLPQQFRVTFPNPRTPVATPILSPQRTAELQKSLATFSDLLNIKLPETAARVSLDTVAAKARVIASLQPEPAFRRRLNAEISFGGLSLDHFSGGLVNVVHERIVPAMACPDFKEPVYQLLVDLGDEYLVPNLNRVPPNTLSLMLTNQTFIESFMVGLNHEFVRELLFREYPTDQRCSAFRQFWGSEGIPPAPGLTATQIAESKKDITPIHTWLRSSGIGSHSLRTNDHDSSSGDNNKVVLIIRGDLLKRYPNTIIYTQSARWGTADRRNELILHDEDGSAAAADINDNDIFFPVFKAQVKPDLHFIGFDLTLSEVRGHPELEETATARRSIPPGELGKFFVLQEIVGEPRFGLDVSPATQPSPDKWDNMAWTHVNLSSGPVVDLGVALNGSVPGTDASGLAWGNNAADMASILYQKPAMLAIHGREMLKDL